MLFAVLLIVSMLDYAWVRSCTCTVLYVLMHLVCIWVFTLVGSRRTLLRQICRIGFGVGFVARCVLQVGKTRLSR
jgi:hypothetical protein